jgi:MFS family permease
MKVHHALPLRVPIVMFASLHIFLCAGVIYGWPSLLIMLISEPTGTFGEGCPAHSPKPCTFQTLRLNWVFTAASVASTGSSLVCGFLLDIFGPRTTNFLCGMTFSIGAVIFGLSNSMYIDGFLPGAVLMALSGPGILLTGLSVANLFPHHRRLVMGTLSGSFTLSSFVFSIFRAVHDVFGITRLPLFLILACIVAVYTCAATLVWDRHPFILPHHHSHHQHHSHHSPQKKRLDKGKDPHAIAKDEEYQPLLQHQDADAAEDADEKEDQKEDVRVISTQTTPIRIPKSAALPRRMQSILTPFSPALSSGPAHPPSWGLVAPTSHTSASLHWHLSEVKPAAGSVSSRSRGGRSQRLGTKVSSSLRGSSTAASVTGSLLSSSKGGMVLSPGRGPEGLHSLLTAHRNRDSMDDHESAVGKTRENAKEKGQEKAAGEALLVEEVTECEGGTVPVTVVARQLFQPNGTHLDGSPRIGAADINDMHHTNTNDDGDDDDEGMLPSSPSVFRVIGREASTASSSQQPSPEGRKRAGSTPLSTPLSGRAPRRHSIHSPTPHPGPQAQRSPLMDAVSIFPDSLPMQLLFGEGGSEEGTTPRVGFGPPLIDPLPILSQAATLTLSPGQIYAIRTERGFRTDHLTSSSNSSAAAPPPAPIVAIHEGQRHGNDDQPQKVEAVASSPTTGANLTFVQPVGNVRFGPQVMSVAFWLLTLYMMVHVLRINFTAGSISIQLEEMGDDALFYVNLYILIFPLGFLSIPLVGWLLDRWRFVIGFEAINILALITGLLLMIPWLPLQILTFVLFAGLRPFLFTAMYGFIGSRFGFTHYGKLVGICVGIAAVGSLSQTLLLYVTIFYLNGNFFLVNLFLNLIVLPLFPIAFVCAKYEPGTRWAWLKSQLESGSSSSSSSSSSASTVGDNDNSMILDEDLDLPFPSIPRGNLLNTSLN